MMVASTIVPVAIFSPFAARCRLHCVEQPPAQIVRFQQVAEAARRGLVRHRLVTEIGSDKAVHRLRIVQRLFHRRVRQVEPVLQE
jgi:hypothetical protein